MAKKKVTKPKPKPEAAAPPPQEAAARGADATPPLKTEPPPLVIETTEDLHADAANPRSMSDEAGEGLRASIRRFGDLSGIVFNQRTGELVCGHQRMTQIRQQYGDREIEVVDAAAGLGVIRIDAPSPGEKQHVFPVRVVDWTRAKQRTANVAANNQKTQGQFTDDLSTFLLEVQEDVAGELGTMTYDELMLVGLIDVDIPEDPKNVDIPESYSVICEVESEEQQAEVHDLLTKKGWKCRVLTT